MMKFALSALNLPIILLLNCMAWIANAEPAAPSAVELDKLAAEMPKLQPDQEYVVIAWNDLGMHCMNFNYSKLVVLPPYNVLWAQVIRRGNPPMLVSEGVELSYRFPGNTTSANKVNFWDYEDQLFGVELPDNIGLTGRGLAGTLDWNGTAFVAEGIPLTPFSDAEPTVEDPYQMAEISLRDLDTRAVLDQTMVVAPVSTEINCGKCHGTRSGDPEAAILAAHNEEYNIGDGPVLCASCHASNALGTTGMREARSLSYRMHAKHAEAQSEGREVGCYDCHPGQNTQCLRGAMVRVGNHKCEDCHGTLQQMTLDMRNGREPWLEEPMCATCHPNHPEEPSTLYRNSRGHGGVYCAACHNSPHAELPTLQPRDGMQAMRLQGNDSFLSDCSICHTTLPTAAGPHGLMPDDNHVAPDQWGLY